MLADIDAHVMGGDPRDIYSKNHEFWSATAAMSVAITVIDTLPLGLHLVVARGMAGHRNARTHEVKETTFERTWIAQRDQLAKVRGSDVREPPPADGQAMQVPRTTNADILQLAGYWQGAWTKLEDAWKRGRRAGPHRQSPGPRGRARPVATGDGRRRPDRQGRQPAGRLPQE